jgi:hypothetical protein
LLGAVSPDGSSILTRCKSDISCWARKEPADNAKPDYLPGIRLIGGVRKIEDIVWIWRVIKFQISPES